MSLKYEPASEPLHIFVKQLFSNVRSIPRASSGAGSVSVHDVNACAENPKLNFLQEMTEEPLMTATEMQT